jgi:hypothetical protein
LALSIPKLDVTPSAHPLGWRRASVHTLVIVLCMVAIVVHQTWGRMWGWYIEDAAISFAYARHLAHGEGLVPFPGGELIEGYSNASWVFLMALFDMVGVDGFSSSKWMGMFFGALTAPMTYFIAREALPDHREDIPLLAPIALAASAQFAIWNASGLENSLFNFLMALGVWRVLVESRTGRWPWSALAFFFLSTTRPEGIMYAAFAGFCAMCFATARQADDGRNKWADAALYTTKWLLTFFLPWTLYNAWRYWYFAWEFPNTYYAKDRLYKQLLDWNHSRGWTYTRNWSHEVWAGYFLPLYILGALGVRGWRAVAALVISLMTCLVVMYPNSGLFGLLDWRGIFETIGLSSKGPWDPNTWMWPQENIVWPNGDRFFPRKWWDGVKILTLTGTAVLVPILAVGGKGWRVRTMSWGLGVIAVFFCVWAKGDWMKGFRWYSLLAVPMAVMFALGVAELAELVHRLFERRSTQWGHAAWLIAGLVGALLVPPNLNHSGWFEKKRETGPFSVRRRVNYVTEAAKRVHLEERPVVWDVDQGAHLFWSDFWMLDMAGLVDVSVAHHQFEKPFMREYVFEEWRPHFAHVHGGWAKNSRIPTHPEWKRDYVEYPGYGAGKSSLHVGNHVRRDLLLVDKWKRNKLKRRVAFEDGIVIEGFHLPSPETARARSFYIEVAMSSDKREPEDDFRVLLLLSNEVPDDKNPGEMLTNVATWDVPVGYDWVPPSEWRPGEVFWGKYSLALPRHLPLGDYQVGFVVVKGDGTIAQPLAAMPEELPDETGEGWIPPSLPPSVGIGGFNEVPPRFAVGEVRYLQSKFKITSVDDNADNAREDRQAAYDAAQANECKKAEDRWFQARMHRPINEKWRAEYEPGIEMALASCWARLALQDPDNEVPWLEKARQHNHHSPEYLAAAEITADALFEKALKAKEDKDWESAYRLFSDVLRVDPQRSWARRYAEEARDHRLGLDDEAKEKVEEERQERMKRMRERREKLEKDKAKKVDPKDPKEAGQQPGGPKPTRP